MSDACKADTIKITKSEGCIYDVAQVAGVSIGTVSRVFNNKPDVAAKTRHIVLQAARTVNYMPRISRRRINIGLVVQEVEHASEVGFVSRVISTLARDVSAQGAVLELMPIGEIDDAYKNYVRGIIALTFKPLGDLLEPVKHLPVVLINNDFSDVRFHAVASDHRQGAYAATRYMLNSGHRRIAFLEVTNWNWGGSEREQGYKAALKVAGIEANPNLVEFCDGREIRNVVEDVLEHNPTAMVVCGEDLSLLVNQVILQDLKIRVPDDLSIISYETPRVSSILSPPQTTIAQPWEDIGSAAAEGILSLVDDAHNGRLNVMFSNRLIERESVRTIS